MSATFWAASHTERVATSLKYEVLVPTIQVTIPDYQSESWITARALLAALPLESPDPEFQDSYTEFRQMVSELVDADPWTPCTLGLDWQEGMIDLG